MQHILMKQVLGGKYSKWIIILQEFDLEFEKAKSEKSLVFTELIFLLSSPDTELVQKIIFRMRLSFTLTLRISSTGTLFDISKPKKFHPNFLALIVGASDIRPDGTLLSKKHYTIVDLTPFCDIFRLMRKLRES